IHGYCLGLVQDYCGELRLPEQLQLVEDRERRQLWERFAAQTPLLAELTATPVGSALLRFASLADLLDLAGRFRPGTEIPEPGPEPPDLSHLAGASGRASARNRDRIEHFISEFLRAWSEPGGFVRLPRPIKSSKAHEFLRPGFRPLLHWLEEASAWFAHQLSAAFRQACLIRGKLTYADQIDLCFDLLRTPRVADEVRRRQPTVILDEAQDTDLRMFRILIEITRPLGSEWGAWPGTGQPPLPGGFSMVGDPRQTIYEGHGLETFNELAAQFRERNGGALVEFTTTYRCSHEVVRQINSLFGDTQVGLVPFGSLAARVTAENGFVWRLPVRSGSDEEDKLKAECQTLATWLAADGLTKIAVPADGRVAVLAPRHAWLEMLGDALRDQRIPFSFYRPKIRRSSLPAFSWPIALVYTVLRPWDRFERIGVLREVFGIPDTALQKVGEQRSPDLVAAEESLNGFQEGLQIRPPVTNLDLLDRLLIHFQVSHRLAALGESRRGLAQLRAEAVIADQDRLDIFAWLDRLLTTLSEPGQPAEQTFQRLELITCHSAKGLEWDVVIPLGLFRAQEQRNQRYPRVLSEEVSRVVWSNLSPHAYPDDSDELERIRRLFYVTLTRARIGLVLPVPEGHDERKPENTFADAIPGKLRAIPELGERPTETWNSKGVVSGPEPVSFERTGEHPVRPSPRLVRPHALADDSTILPVHFGEPAGIYAYGSWWHEWAEHFPWLGDDAVQQEYVRQTNVSPDFKERAEREIQLFLASSELGAIRENGQLFLSEYPFSWARNELEWLEGVIDLLVVGKDHELWLVDWKTNQATSNEGTAAFRTRLREKYEPQLATYAEAIQSLAAERRIRRAIYSTALGGFV
ncbi:MAG: UvrD-helicase domain-containing protein, partial [Verrucomicrobia bacterium]|nr:UvrD-helicase domain-containing protein [Verrucomicrobiota bacterium]